MQTASEMKPRAEQGRGCDRSYARESHVDHTSTCQLLGKERDKVEGNEHGKRQSDRTSTARSVVTQN